MIDFDTIVLLALIVAGVWMLSLSYRLDVLVKLNKNMYELLDAFLEDMEDEDEQAT